MKKKPFLSAIIACYKDEQAILFMYRRLTEVFQKLGVRYEIIFVNDGSPDNSENVITEIVKKDTHVVGINHARNFSSQMAFTSGLEIATGNAVILLDGDLQDPPEMIPKLYARWRQGFDVVYGVRTNREASMFMNVMYKLFYRLFHQLSYIRIPLDAGDFSLMDRRVVDALLQLPERDRFLRGLRAWVGFRQTGVEYKRPERMFGTTTNSLIKNFHWATKGIFSFSFVPLEMMTILSLITFVVSLAAIVFQIVVRLLVPSTPKGITTVLIVILFFGAIQMLGISILGEYIAKIFEEVKQRPKFIRKSIIRHGVKKKTS